MIPDGEVGCKICEKSIHRLFTEHIQEHLGKSNKTRLNEILDRIEVEVIHDFGQDDMVSAVEAFSSRLREAVEKL